MGARAARRLTALVAAAAVAATGLAGAGAGAAVSRVWSVQPTPNPAGPLDSELFGVSCASASACMAVGYATQGTVRSLLAERFDGSRWRLARPQAPPGAATADLLGVSCPAANACVAIGDYRARSGLTRTLAERWNGTRWSIEPTLDPGRPYRHPTLDSGTELSGVSCASADSCIAVGDYLDRRHRDVALIERFDGRAWSRESTPSPLQRQLGGASCSSAAGCTAVGERRRGFGVLLPVVERSRGGRWMLAGAPASRVPGSMTNILVSVSCGSGSACAAVGERSTAAGGFAPFAERYAAGRWTVVATPSPSEGLLGAVSCVSADACTAVGLGENASRSRTRALIERWNGRGWALEPGATLPRGRSGGGLGAVSCVSRAVCVAVGFADYTAGGVQRTLTLAERRS